MPASSMQFRLDTESETLLKAALLHLVVRGGEVVGRYGRTGHVAGRLDAAVLTATLTEPSRRAEMRVTFNPDFGSFQGHVKFEQEPDRKIAGTRVTR